MVDWTEKYRPTSLDEVYGNKSAINDFKDWADNWDEHQEAVILYGPPGVGKTTAAHALANDRGWNTVELNASDKRTRDEIEAVAGGASANETLMGGKSLLIVDEADNIHGNYDRGGKKALTEIIKSAEQPIVLLANNFYDMSRGLRNACQDIEFKYVDEKEVGKKLRDICDAEGIDYDIDSILKIAEHADGDVRSAVNDLQSIASGKDSIKGEDIATSKRKQEVGIFDYMNTVLKKGTAKEAYDNARSVDQTPDELIRWVENNVAKVYEPEELAVAYDFLSNADVWLGRTRATQEYKYWRYASANMTAGVASARKGEKGGWTSYRPQSYRRESKTQKEVSRKIGATAGASMQTAKLEILPFLSAMTHHCKPRDLTVRMAAYYDFDEEEVAFVTGSGETTNKVQSIVEDAQEMQDEDIVIDTHTIEPEEPPEKVTEEETTEEETEPNVTLEAETATADPPDPDKEEETEDEEEPDEKTIEEDAGDDDDQAGLSDFM